MCIIIYSPAADPSFNLPKITRNQLREAMYSNPHGFGVMYAEDGKLNIIKTFSKERVWKEVSRVQKAGLPWAFHARWTTHGTTTHDNIHPFKVADDVAMMHNGIMSWAGGDDDKSDTANFCELLRQLDVKKALNNRFFYKALKEMAGYGNKLLFMDNEGRVHITNESAGVWKNGMWFSNTYSIDSLFVTKPMLQFTRTRPPLKVVAKANGTAVLEFDDADYAKARKEQEDHSVDTQEKLDAWLQRADDAFDEMKNIGGDGMRLNEDDYYDDFDDEEAEYYPRVYNQC